MGLPEYVPGVTGTATAMSPVVPPTQEPPHPELIQYFVNMGLNPQTAIQLAAKVGTMEPPAPPLANGIKLTPGKSNMTSPLQVDKLDYPHTSFLTSGLRTMDDVSDMANDQFAQAHGGMDRETYKHYSSLSPADQAVWQVEQGRIKANILANTSAARAKRQQNEALALQQDTEQTNEGSESEVTGKGKLPSDIEEALKGSNMTYPAPEPLRTQAAVLAPPETPEDISLGPNFDRILPSKRYR